MEVPWGNLIAFCMGLAFLALAIASASELQRFSPVYEDVFCMPDATGLGSVQTSPLQVTITVDIVCRNPNPYEIAVHPAGVGRALLGEGQQEVGRVTAADTIVPAAARGEVALGTLVMNVQVKLGLFETLTLMSSLLQGAFTVFFDLKLAVMIEPVILGLSAFMVEIAVQQHCGMQIQVLPRQDSGHCVCSDASFDALDVPALDVPSIEESVSSADDTGISPNVSEEANETVPPNEEWSADDMGGESSADAMGISPDVSEEMIQTAESARDAFCGAVMALGLLLAVLLISWSLFSFFRKTMRKGKPDVRVIEGTLPAAPAAIIGKGSE